MNDPTIISSEELQNHDYRFVVRRNSPEPTGWCGTFYREDLIAFDGFIEAAVQNFFGGGRYSVKIYEDAVPQPGVVRVSIYGAPKEESRKEREENQVEKLKKELERRESQREKESQQKFHELGKESEIDKLEKKIERLESQLNSQSEQRVDELKDEPSESALRKNALGVF